MPRQERTKSGTDIYHLILRDNTPLLWRFGGGYVELNANGTPTSWNYYVTDHLGSTRMVVDSNDSIKEVINYYPFGAIYGDVGTDDALQRYKYNGKELDRMHGLNQYDYGARNYDPHMCRFTQMDPLAENYYNVSPYAYCANNPINAVDYEGKRIIFVQGYLVGRPSGEKYWGGRHSSFVVGAQKYFNDYSQPLFTNNDLSYWDSSTFSRFNKGYNYAKK